MGVDGDREEAESERFFCGFRPPAQVNALLLAVMRTCEGLTNGSCVAERPANLHMTLCYLGAVREDAALSFLLSVVPAVPRPSFGFAELGFSRGGHLWARWNCLRAAEQLDALRLDCQAALQKQHMGQVGSQLPWLPHVTLAKRVLPRSGSFLPSETSGHGYVPATASFLRLLNAACAPELRELSRLEWNPHEVTLWRSVRHRMPAQDYDARANVLLSCAKS